MYCILVLFQTDPFLFFVIGSHCTVAPAFMSHLAELYHSDSLQESDTVMRVWLCQHCPNVFKVQRGKEMVS